MSTADVYTEAIHGMIRVPPMPEVKRPYSTNELLVQILEELKKLNSRHTEEVYKLQE